MNMISCVQCLHMSTYVYIDAYINIHINIWRELHTHIQFYLHVYLCRNDVCICSYMCINIYTHTCYSPLQNLVPAVYLKTHQQQTQNCTLICQRMALFDFVYIFWCNYSAFLYIHICLYKYMLWFVIVVSQFSLVNLFQTSFFKFQILSLVVPNTKTSSLYILQVIGLQLAKLATVGWKIVMVRKVRKRLITHKIKRNCY
jgi:hypothetical protein